MKKFPSLGQRGFSHHFILLLIIVVSISGFGAYVVMQSKADTNAYTARKANGCWPGERKNNKDQCNPIPDLSTRLQDCGAYHLQPQGGDRCVNSCSGGSCYADCIGGWHVSATSGDCQQNQGPGGDPGGGGGGGGGGGNPDDKTKADCDNLNREFNNAAKQCGDCKHGYHQDPSKERGTCLQDSTGGGGGGGTGGGSTGGGGGTTHSGGPGGSTGGGGGTTHGGGTGGGTPASSTAAPNTTDDGHKGAMARCAIKNLEYNDKTNNCGTRCVDGYTKTVDGTCVMGNTTCQGIVIADGTCVGKNKVEDYCKNFHFEYNKNRNACEAKCVDGFVMTAGVCAKKGTDPATHPPVLNLDTNMGRKTCEALGRQWEPGTPDENNNKIKGCSTNACDKQKSSHIVANTADGAPYCSGYITKNEKSACESKLHRNWIPEVKGCMQSPKVEKAGTRNPRAPECQPQYSTYVWRDGGADTCVEPTVPDHVQAAAHTAASPLAAVAHQSQAQACKLHPNKHWTGKKCVEDTPGHASGSNGSGHSAEGNTDPVGEVHPNAGECGSLHRKWLGTKCAYSGVTLPNGKASAYCNPSSYAYLHVPSDKYDHCASVADHVGATSTSTPSTTTSTPSCPNGTVKAGECIPHGGTSTSTTPDGSAAHPYIRTACSSMASLSSHVRCTNIKPDVGAPTCNVPLHTETILVGTAYYSGPVCQLV